MPAPLLNYRLDVASGLVCEAYVPPDAPGGHHTSHGTDTGYCGQPAKCFRYDARTDLGDFVCEQHMYVPFRSYQHACAVARGEEPDA